MGLDNGYSTPDVSVFPLGTPQAMFTASTNRSDGTANVMPHGLALTADGTFLFAVTADDVYQTSFSLHVLPLTGAATATALVASANPTVVGQPVTFTATVSGGSSPSGTVTFSDGQSVLATVGLASGSASYTTSALSVGSHQISATYSGDASNQSSAGGLAETVSKATSQTTLTSSPTSARKRTTVTFVAKVTVNPTNVTPTGTVSFYDDSGSNGVLLGTVALSNGNASFSTSALAPGTHLIAAVYGGDANVSGSHGQVSVVISK
jgi:type IV secretory pathway TrbL component